MSAEEARKSRASDWMSAHVKLGREWSPPWDRVMGALPVGDAGYSALSRSSRLCPSFPPSKWKLNRTTQLAPVSHPAVLLQGPGSFFRTNHVLQSRILS